MASPPEPSTFQPKFFPAPELAGPDGLIGIGGKLDTDWLLDAYRHGIFPWPDNDEDPLLWWSPDPRAVIEFQDFHVSSRLRRRIRSGRFHVTCNQDFAGVIRQCATAPDRKGGTWITPQMLDAYTRLHKQGHAHSVEVWLGEQPDKRLVGGVYGVAVGGAFAAESMFHLETDASKVALYYLLQHLKARGYQLLDIQQWTQHTGSLGATEIPRSVYLPRLQHAVSLPVSFGDQLEVHLPA